MYGFMGKLLFVDLSTGETEIRPLDESDAYGFLGGPSLGAKILFDNMPPHTDPFSAESYLGFVSGALNNSGSFMAGRYVVCCRSPINGKWNDANSGGTFASYLRSSGFDGIFIKGIADKPVYLLVDNGHAEIRDASHLWGKKISETEDLLREDLGSGGKFRAAMIGPVGESKGLMGCIMNDMHRAAGRGGAGAVMGSKNLKAVVCRGSAKLEVFDRQRVLAVNKGLVEWTTNGPVKELAAGFRTLGTGAGTEGSVLAGDASVKNWTGSGIADMAPEDIKKLNASEMDKKYYRKKYACFACPIGCGAVYEVEDKNKVINTETSRPEYETVGGFGSQMLNSDTESINVCNFYCNEYGMDTISTSATIAWAMECYEEGKLSKEQLDGIELTWGNADAIMAITEKIAKVEGVGKILCNGSRWASRHWGVGEEFLCDADGIEIAQHDPRLGPGLGRTYKFDPVPGRHTKGGLGVVCGFQAPEVKFNPDVLTDGDLEGTVFSEITQCSGLCDFVNWAMPNCIEMLNAVMGDRWDEEERRSLGIRLFIMRLCFNQREGYTRKDCHLSARMRGAPPLAEGPLAGVDISEQIERMADNLFDAMGIKKEDMTVPRETLEKLGHMDSVIRQLYPES